MQKVTRVLFVAANVMFIAAALSFLLGPVLAWAGFVGWRICWLASVVLAVLAFWVLLIVIAWNVIPSQPQAGNTE